jgi:hypothetical protein
MAGSGGRRREARDDHEGAHAEGGGNCEQALRKSRSGSHVNSPSVSFQRPFRRMNLGLHEPCQFLKTADFCGFIA